MKPWTITFGDKSWTAEQVSRGAILKVLATMYGDEWEIGSPHTGPLSLMRWLTVLIGFDLAGPDSDAATLTKAFEAAESLVDVMSVTDIYACLVDRDPPDTGVAAVVPDAPVAPPSFVAA